MNTNFEFKENENDITITKYIGDSDSVLILNIVNDKDVTKIGSSAFKGCTKLTNLKIPDSVIEIAANAFNGCINLTTIKCSSNSVLNKMFKPCIPNNLMHNFISNDFKQLNSINKENMFFYLIINAPDKITSDVSNYFKRKKIFS